MCSIFGVGLYNGHRMHSESTLTGIMSRLFKAAEVGGKRAAGLSIMREKTAHVLRRPLSGSQLVSTEEYLDFMEDNLDLADKENRVMSIIGHCRFPTKGSEDVNENNHPQVVGSMIGVHNGHITNDDELFEKFSKVLTRQAEVDTEIIFQLINHFNNPPKAKTIDSINTAAPYLNGSYACAMQNRKHPYNLYLFRHSNPIKIRYFPQLGLVFFATRMHFIENALCSFLDESGEHDDLELVQNQGSVFNLHARAQCKFLFTDKDEAEKMNHA